MEEPGEENVREADRRAIRGKIATGEIRSEDIKEESGTDSSSASEEAAGA